MEPEHWKEIMIKISSKRLKIQVVGFQAGCLGASKFQLSIYSDSK